MKYRRIVFGLFLGLFLLMSTSSLLWAGEPGDLIKGIILKDISLEEGEGLDERKQELWREISQSLDFAEIAKRVMGKYWKERSPQEKEEFVEFNLLSYSSKEIIGISLVMLSKFF